MIGNITNKTEFNTIVKANANDHYTHLKIRDFHFFQCFLDILKLTSVTDMRLL